MRYTKSEVHKMFTHLVKLLCQINGFSSNPKDYKLDYVSIYGGYVIEKLENEQGGISNPLGSLRRSAAEMYLSMQMTAYTLERMLYTPKGEE